MSMPVMQWINVADKLPGLGVRVIATDGQMVGEAFLYGHSKEWYRPYSKPWEAVFGPVTQWMPLPQPWKEE